MSEKEIILFDIDRTLFNTDKYVPDLRSKFDEWDKKYGNANDIYNEYCRCFGETYSFDFFVLVEKFVKNIDLRQEMLDYISNPLASYVFSDVIPCMQNLSKHFKLGIYSEGSLFYQRNKFLKLNLTNYLERDLIYIVANKRTVDIISQLPKCTIVDDNPDVINALNKFNSEIKTIHIDRFSINRGIQSITTLDEFVDLIL